MLYIYFKECACIYIIFYNDLYIDYAIWKTIIKSQYNVFHIEINVPEFYLLTFSHVLVKQNYDL